MGDREKLLVNAGKAGLYVTAALAVAAGTAVYLWRDSQPEVKIGHLTRGPAVEAIYATGVVEPVSWAKVTPVVRGRIAEIFAGEGQPVKKGAVLARLDDEEARARLVELEARADFLDHEHERYRKLLERRIVSSEAYHRVASDLAQARAAIAAQRERLDDYSLRAPMDGVILRKDGEVGEVAKPEDILFWVGKPTPLWIVAEVDEEDIPLVRLGLKALIKADAFPGRILDGKVREITPKGDPVNKNYRVRIGLPPDTPLMIGMTTEVNIVVREVKEALLLSAEAVSDGRVFVLEDGRARVRKVKVGITSDNMVEIVSGLAEPDEVIFNPPAGLEEGDRVRTDS